MKIIVTSVTRNVTIQTNNSIKYNIKTDKSLLFCLFLRLYNMVLVAGVKQTTQHNILYLLGNYEHIRAIYLNILYNVYVYLQENIAKLLTIVYNH